VPKLYCCSCKEKLPVAGITVFLFISFVFHLNAQSFEGYSFQSLNVPSNARLLGLGGKNVSSVDADPSMFLSNPGTLSKKMDNKASFSYLPYFAKTNFLSAGFVKDFAKFGTWGAAINYMNYGSFEGYDPSGEYTGNFKASDYALVLSNAHSKENFSFGASAKFTGSFIAGYSSNALLFDVGGMFIHPEKDFTIGLAIKNLGFGLKNYNETSSFTMPFDVQLGSSFKPEHMPLRFSLTLHNLNKFKVLDKEEDGKEIAVGKQVFSHMVFGAEILVSKNINLRAGYDYFRRQQIKQDKGGFSGFSFGAMIRIKGFEFAYSRGIFNQAGAQNCITLNVDINSFLKSK
jgi:hypothetical protein